jgi:hypothetical protein
MGRVTSVVCRCQLCRAAGPEVALSAESMSGEERQVDERYVSDGWLVIGPTDETLVVFKIRVCPACVPRVASALVERSARTNPLYAVTPVVVCTPPAIDLRVRTTSP